MSKSTLHFTFSTLHIVYEVTLPVDARGGWRQYFLSAKPFSAEGWMLSGMRLEWSDSSGANGVLPSGCPDDSFRVPLSGTATNLTLRLVVEAETVRSPRPLYLLGYEPSVVLSVSGIRTVQLSDGRSLYVALHKEAHGIQLVFDRSSRPCAAPVAAEEGAALPDTELFGFDCEPVFNGVVATSLRLLDRGPGVYPIGGLLDSFRRVADRPGGAAAPPALLAVLNPSF
ncbi:MAG: hypothetical protein J5985_00815, partial [Kiritimatiellae bacterium]|nr:hypothetical protein [Kiritimatiellia bacterium]